MLQETVQSRSDQCRRSLGPGDAHHGIGRTSHGGSLFSVFSYGFLTFYLKARHSYLAILKRFPHDLTTLESLRPLLIELSDLKTCADLFQSAFNHYSAVYPIPIPDPELNQPPSPFGQMEVLCLTDLYNTLGQHEQAIHAIKSGSRWLQGRRDETYWDMCEDDREFDLRTEEGDSSTAVVTREREGDLTPGHFPLDVNARHRLAIARIKMGDIGEGKVRPARLSLSKPQQYPDPDSADAC